MRTYKTHVLPLNDIYTFIENRRVKFDICQYSSDQGSFFFLRFEKHKIFKCIVYGKSIKDIFTKMRHRIPKL